MLSIVRRAKVAAASLTKGEIAEAMVATWCVEFLRMRKVGGFNVVEMMVISLMMIAIKGVIIKVTRRHHAKTSFVPTRFTQAGQAHPTRRGTSAEDWGFASVRTPRP